jgi:hypothetical protein
MYKGVPPVPTQEQEAKKNVKQNFNPKGFSFYEHYHLPDH